MFQKISALGRVFIVMLCLALGCASFAGCSQMDDIVSNVTAAGVFPVEVNGVTIASRPQKAVVLSPSLADVVLALGCETQLVGVSQECTQANLNELTKISADDVQGIQDLQPDLVLLDSASSAAQSALEDAGLTVLSVEPATDRSDFERLYSQVSSAFSGGEAGYDAGIAAAQDIFITLDNINRIVPKDTVTTACYLYDLESSAVTGDMFASTIMSYAGVTNVFESVKGGTYDFDTLEMSNPNVIFCAPGLKEQIEKDSRFSGFQAVQQGKIFELDTSLMEWQGRTIIDAAYEISANSFPQLLESSSTLASDPTQQIEEEVSSALEEQANYETLQEGDQGDAVVAIQERLEQLGYLTDPYDGHFGATTADCVSRFQTANGLEVTGVADPATQAALFAEGALREDGTPLPEEESAASESSDTESSSASSESADSESSGESSASDGTESSSSENASSESSASA